MKKKEPRYRPAEERREQLLTAAQQIFAERGAARATIDDIVEAAGVAKGSFYLHFDSKDDVRAALGERFTAQVLKRIRSAVDTAGDPVSKLRQWARAGAAAYLELLELHELAFAGAAANVRAAHHVDNPIIEHLAELLTAGQRAGAWSLEEPRYTALLLFSALHAGVDDAALEGKAARAKLGQRLAQHALRVVGRAQP